uniref:Uncharacterized protein n=1 Tax=Arundo donax TaxID=35708 RepID=A0A0A9F420_ARUDO
MIAASDLNYICMLASARSAQSSKTEPAISSYALGCYEWSVFLTVSTTNI